MTDGPFDLLATGISSYLTDQGVTAIVDVGSRSYAKQVNQGPGRANRIILIPGDDPQTGGGAGGKITGPRRSGGNPRHLFNVAWELLVSIWGYDGTAATNERAQIVATQTLFRWVARAVQDFAKADATWGSFDWTPQPERAFGREILASLTYNAPFDDVEAGTATPGPQINRGDLTP